MHNLSSSFSPEFFQKEFSGLFPGKIFDQSNILNYITACAKQVTDEALKRYPMHGLKFINPVFVVNSEICAPAALSGDNIVLRSIYDSYNLVQSKAIFPISLPVINNNWAGLCLFFDDIDNIYPYHVFKPFNLEHIFTEIDPLHNFKDKYYQANDVMNLKINLEQLPLPFLEFASALKITNEEDAIKLAKTLILYKNRSQTFSSSMVLSSVNRHRPVTTFFDLLFNIISEKPFDEASLLDFTHIIEHISLPVVNHYNEIKNDASKNKTNKRAELLQKELQNNIWVNGKKIKK